KKEVEKRTLAIRTLDGKVKFGIKVEDFLDNIIKCISNREQKFEI
ncbi:hypothetical protein HY498_04810, partial [Candidatus Woesearchaeota archaeon]|nr:hypothetical protein [Candidatus Woesearchaeota archaeon]